MDIFLYSPINSAEEVAEQIRKAGKQPIDLHINSPGGNVFAGFAIYNLLKQRGNITVHIDGLAASIASVIAMAGDTIHMSESSQLMLHNSSMMVGGNKEEIAKQVELLAKIDNQLIDIYHSRSGLAKDKIADLLTEETFLNANEALSFGLIDSIIDNKQVAAYLTNYNNMNKEDVMNGVKALGLNLGFVKEEEVTEEVTKKAETIKEVTDKKVTEEEIKRTEDLEGTNILTADMVPMAQYKAEFLQLQNAFKIVVDYIEDQPTKDEIKEWVSGISNDYFKTLLSEVKSKTEVPRPSNNFEEVIIEKEEIEKENKEYAQQKLEEINKQFEN